MTTSPNILMVTPRFFPEMGGIETHVYEVSRRLVNQGCRITVLTADRSRQRPARETVEGVEIRRVPAWPKERDYYVAPSLYRHILASDADLLHVQGYHTFVPPLAMTAALRKRLPYILTFHSGGHSSAFRNALRWPQHRTLVPLVRRATHLIGVSEFEANFFSRRIGVPRDRFQVIRNGAQMPEVPTEAEVGAAPLIISVGRLERYKGHHRLISALPHLLKKMPDARVRIVGVGPFKEELTSLAARLGVADRVIIAGVPPDDRAGLAALVGRAALVVLLSEYEAHPVAVMEAMALRRRVLVTDCSGFKEMVDGDVVTAVPLRADERRIAEAIFDQASKGPVVHGVDLPSWDQCASRLRVTYQNVIAKQAFR
jgi:glycosyltransferase involved in cell wall biosynthesis